MCPVKPLVLNPQPPNLEAAVIITVTAASNGRKNRNYDILVAIGGYNTLLLLYSSSFLKMADYSELFLICMLTQ